MNSAGEKDVVRCAPCRARRRLATGLAILCAGLVPFIDSMIAGRRGPA